MIRAQNEATAVLFVADATNGETASGYVDTLDYDYCTIDVVAATTNDTTNNFTTLNVAEGAATNAYTNIAACVGDSTFTIPAGDTSNAQVVARFNIDCNHYERYLKVEAAVLTTQAIAAIARLGYKDEVDTSTSTLGQGVIVTV